MSETTSSHTQAEAENKAAAPSFLEYKSRISKETLAKIVELCIGINPVVDTEFSGDQLFEHLKADQAHIRAKYRLPEDPRIVGSAEYYNALLQLARQQGVEIRHREEVAAFFEERPEAGGVFIDTLGTNGAIAIDNIDNLTKQQLSYYGEPGTPIDKLHEKYRKTQTSALEHEFIHSQQHQRYPRMSTVLAEYEAYLSTMRLAFLEKEPWYLFEAIWLSLDKKTDELESNWSTYQESKAGQA